MTDPEPIGLEPFVWPEATEILPGIFLGCMQDAWNWDGPTVCVHELLDVSNADAHWIPILDGVRIEDPDGVRADRFMLDAAALVVRSYQKKGVKVLLHCQAGVERSGLAMAWFLKKYGYMKTLPEAYKWIQAKRPIVEDRLCWLAPLQRN